MELEARPAGRREGKCGSIFSRCGCCMQGAGKGQPKSRLKAGTSLKGSVRKLQDLQPWAACVFRKIIYVTIL